MARLAQSRAIAAWLFVSLAACSSTPSQQTEPDTAIIDSGADETSSPPNDSGDPCVLSTTGCNPPDSSTDTHTAETDPPDTADTDSGVPDTDPTDSSVADSGSADTDPLDTGVIDSGTDTADSTVTDTDPGDTGTADTSTADTYVPPVDSGSDTTIVDTGSDTSTITDTGVIDSGTDTADSTVTDSGSTDTGVADSYVPPTDSGTDTAPADTGMTNTFSCNSSSWTMNAAFHDFQEHDTYGTYYDVKAIGGIWGTSTSNVYVTIGAASHGAVAYWNGSTWTQEEVDTSPATTNDPVNTYGIWGTSDSDIWVAAKGAGQAVLYHKTSGVWTKDATVPYVEGFIDIWGTSSSNKFLVGWKPGESMIWHNTGSGWVKQTLPVPSATPYRKFSGRVWGVDAAHVYVPGYYVDSTLTQVAGFVMYFDGTSWTEVAAPSECVEAGFVHGTSTDDLYVSCVKSDWTGIIYHVTGGIAAGKWTASYLADAAGSGAVYSKFPGTAIALSSDTTMSYMRATTLDQVSSPVTTPIIGSFLPAVIWADPTPGSSWFWISHIGPGAGKAGIYAGSCN